MRDPERPKLLVHEVEALAAGTRILVRWSEGGGLREYVVTVQDGERCASLPRDCELHDHPFGHRLIDTIDGRRVLLHDVYPKDSTGKAT